MGPVRNFLGQALFDYRPSPREAKTETMGWDPGRRNSSIGYGGRDF